MKKLLFILGATLVFSSFGYAQTEIITTSFEGPGFDSGWTIGVSQAITEAPTDYPSGLDPWEKWGLTDNTGFGYVHSGDSAAFIGGTAYAEPTHDWLMTPEFEVPNDGETQIKYWLWYHSEAGYMNKFYIMIYEEGGFAWEQGYLLANDFNSPYHYIEEYTFDLAPWKGKNIKVAFVKNGTYQMAMDDIRIVTTGNDAVQNIDKADVEIYPNPVTNTLMLDHTANVTAVDVIDILGRLIISINNKSNNKLNIDMSVVERGSYIVNIHYKDNKHTSQLIQKQ